MSSSGIKEQNLMESQNYNNYIIGEDEIIKYIPMFNFETVKQICIEDGIPEPKKDYVWWVSKDAPYGKRFCEYNCEVRIKVLEGIIKRLN